MQGAYSYIFLISIHAAREGGDPFSQHQPITKLSISIHAAREGGDSFVPILVVWATISIHAAREGGDGRLVKGLLHVGDFNPRRP